MDCSHLSISLKIHMVISLSIIFWMGRKYVRAIGLLNGAVEVLEKIEDPRKRDHKEPDEYTEKACIMNMAHQYLDKHKKQLNKELGKL